MLGAAFVICQRYLTQGISEAMRLHEFVLRETQAGLTCCPNRKVEFMKAASKQLAAGGVTEVETINAFANYFKHRDEWRGAWSSFKDQSAYTAAVLIAAGAKESSTGNFRAGSRALGNSDFWKIQIFVNQLAAWRYDLAELHRAELVSRGLVPK
jgi:hypothetical protein